MKRNPARTALIYRIIGLTVSIAGIIMHLLADNVMQPGFMVRHKLAYFTIQTNIGIVLLFAVLIFRTVRQYRREKKWSIPSLSPGLQGALTFYITMTMLGFWLILVPTTGISTQWLVFLSSLILHTVTPLLAIGDWLLFCPHGHLRRKHAALWLFYPAGYLLFVMLFSRTIREPYYSFRMGDRLVELMYPYPFLDPAVMGIWGVIGAAAALAAIFYGFSLLYIALDRKLGARSLK